MFCLLGYPLKAIYEPFETFWMLIFLPGKSILKQQVKRNLNKELAKEVKANVKNAVLPIVKKPIKEVGHFSFLAM